MIHSHTAAQVGKDLLYRCGKRTFKREAGSTFMTAAAPLFGNFSYIDAAFAADAYPDSFPGQLAEEQRNLNAGDSQGIVHQPFAVFVESAAAIHIIPCDPHPGDLVLTMERIQGASEEPHLRCGIGEVDTMRDVRRVRPELHQFSGQLKGMRGCW